MKRKSVMHDFEEVWIVGYTPQDYEEEKMLNKDTRADSVEEEEKMPETIAQEPEVEDSVPDSKPEPEDEFEARLRRLMRD